MTVYSLHKTQSKALHRFAAALRSTPRVACHRRLGAMDSEKWWNLIQKMVAFRFLTLPFCPWEGAKWQRFVLEMCALEGTGVAHRKLEHWVSGLVSSPSWILDMFDNDEILIELWSHNRNMFFLLNDIPAVWRLESCRHIAFVCGPGLPVLFDSCLYSLWSFEVLYMDAGPGFLPSQVWISDVVLWWNPSSKPPTCRWSCNHFSFSDQRLR